MTKYFEYLDNLRASGVTNMFGAGVYLEEDFGLSRAEAKKILLKWMRTFSPDKPMDGRVAEAQDDPR